ncbi:polyurethanase [Enterobacteriaceae bacterium YMB-R22]|uniref:polyurethane esterase n=1 Tax=Tenebrionicola larvae TaxID=2815733 RepID=UPI002012EFE6|nr:polyurethanase [Tenebrionicola larvae]MBV4413554.1 polyurethanase [Tenebrionicola larvae]
MAIFNLSRLDNNASGEVVKDALAIAMYAYHNLDDGFANGYQHTGFGLGLPLTLLTALFGNTESQGGIPGIPWNPDSEAKAQQIVNDAGWFTISAEELGYFGRTDFRGTFYGETDGYRTAQVEILGKYDDAGNLTQIGVAFRGSSGPREVLVSDLVGDIINDLQAGICPAEFSDTYAIKAFGNLLGKVAEFANKNGLTGDKVDVSGHSLGGLAVNSLASQSDSLWGGFYSQANYVAYASPTQYEEGGKVLNIGFENDPVFRVLNGSDLEFSSLFTHDAPHESSTDNIVNFNDYYASDVWNVLPASILNIPSWLSHLPFLYQDLIPRIVDSEFYNYTNQDSTIVVSALSDTTRGSTWVQDLNRYAEKHTGPTFILGSEHDDLIQGGKGIDYLEGNAGNDTLRDKGGFNFISGGEGTDTFDTQAQFDFWSWTQDSHGDIWARDKDGNVFVLNSVEQIKGGYTGLFGLGWHEINGSVTDSGIAFTYAGKTGFKAWDATSEASLNSDSLVTAAKPAAGQSGFLFGYEGDDTLIGTTGDEVFAAGQGDDVIYTGGGSDIVMVTGESFGHDTIYEFGADDKLVFMGNSLIEDDNSLWQYATVKGDDMYISFNDECSITLVGCASMGLNEQQLITA